MSGLIFILILSFLVIIHELGHFLVARWSKITVEEFGMGYPPKAVTIRTDKRGTAYTINWLPFGGFVRMKGEDSDDSTVGSFSSRPVWQRLLVVLAGASVNFIFGVLAFGAIYSRHGIPTDLGMVKIESVGTQSPAAAAAVQPGIMVKQLKVGSVTVVTKTASDLVKVVQQHRGETITLVTNDGKDYPVYVRTAEQTPAGEGSMGVSLTDMEVRYYPWWQMPLRGMWEGTKQAVSFGKLILTSLGDMVVQLATKGKMPQEVSGPVGIVYAAEKEGFLKAGFWAQLNFAAILSINLAIVNVLPFPALDGGRALFLWWELLTRRRVNQKVEIWLNTVGFALLILMIVLISFRDILKVLADPTIRGWFSHLMAR
jgi:regulator of sigma E protease